MEKRTQTYLTIKQRHTVATWLIENGHVTQDKNTDSSDFTYWRTKKITAEKEINEAQLPGLPVLTPHQLSKSLDTFNEVNKCFGYKINVPAIQDTVEMDRLTAKVINLQNQLEQSKLALVAALQTTKDANKHLDTLHKIAQLIPAEACKKR